MVPDTTSDLFYGLMAFVSCLVLYLYLVQRRINRLENEVDSLSTKHKAD